MSTTEEIGNGLARARAASNESNKHVGLSSTTYKQFIGCLATIQAGVAELPFNALNSSIKIARAQATMARNCSYAAAAAVQSMVGGDAPNLLLSDAGYSFRAAARAASGDGPDTMTGQIEVTSLALDDVYKAAAALQAALGRAAQAAGSDLAHAPEAAAQGAEGREMLEAYALLAGITLPDEQ